MAQYLGAAQRQPTKRNIRPVNFRFCQNHYEATLLGQILNRDGITSLS